MTPLRILLVQMGQAAPALQLQAGDYPAWFADALGPESLALTAHPAFEGGPLPDLSPFDAVITTGSPLSVTAFDREPWQARTGDFLLEAAERGKPIFAVCFGHQLLARMLGGRVEKNPRGREIGTIEVTATAAGRAHPIFGALPELRFHATHEDAVTALPPGATLLAENGFGIQAFAVGSRILAVQFHPELDARRTAALIETRAQSLAAEGILERARASVRETAAGKALLAGWIASIRG